MTTGSGLRVGIVWLAAAFGAAGMGLGCSSGDDSAGDADAEADGDIAADVEADADVEPDVDTGADADADGETDGTGDVDAGPEYRFTLRVASDPEGRASPWLDGAPLPGAGVAVDSGFGRREYVADGAGTVEAAVPDDGTPFSVTIAADHHSAVVLLDVTRTDLERWAALHEELFVTLPRIPDRGLIEMITLTVRPSGLPAGARWLASVAGGEYRRADTAAELVFMVPQRSGAVPVLVGLLEDVAGSGETLAELARTELADGTRSGTVEPAFDGVTDHEIETIAAVALELPSDPESPIRTGAVLPESLFGGAVDPATRLTLGFSLNVLERDGAVVFDLAYASIPGVTPSFGWQVAGAAALGSGSTTNLAASFETGRTYSVLDVPRLTVEGTSPATTHSTFTRSPIATADAYRLDFTAFDASFGGRLLWLVHSVRPTDVTLPELPSSHPWPAGWPEPGGIGFAQAWAMRNDHAEGCAGQTDPFCERSWSYGEVVQFTVER